MEDGRQKPEDRSLPEYWRDRSRRRYGSTGVEHWQPSDPRRLKRRQKSETEDRSRRRQDSINLMHRALPNAQVLRHFRGWVAVSLEMAQFEEAGGEAPS
ncbi:hypothetical protein [uncultured Imperialibacter sp.]|uniref:hypothetical protein n=1 Tax=uncultured Imperialibacter sp. TaxID=1672639 RepID=UPI0030DD6899|tara:strand:+ start:185141 stop:185437 length:297 start_codon:yes stop_codon:yes gene_type:complete